jgi:hypothetical protein
MHTKIFLGKSECKGLLVRPMRRWKDNVEIYLTETGYEGVNGFSWLLKEVSGELLWWNLGSIKFGWGGLEFLDQVSDCQLHKKECVSSSWCSIRCLRTGCFTLIFGAGEGGGKGCQLQCRLGRCGLWLHAKCFIYAPQDCMAPQSKITI